MATVQSAARSRLQLSGEGEMEGGREGGRETTLLPTGWRECSDEQGRTYYQDETTRTTQWEHPGVRF